jgi:hypothetical protein
LPVALLVTVPVTTPVAAAAESAANVRGTMSAVESDKTAQSAAWRRPFASEGRRGRDAGWWVIVGKGLRTRDALEVSG